MRTLLRFWWTFETPVNPRAYRRHGAALVLLKYGGDAALIAIATGRLWTPAGYFGFLPSTLATFQDAPGWLMPALAVWTLPFLWTGVTLTTRRAYDAGWSLWWALVFFIPYINYLLMLALCVVPSAGRDPDPRSVPRPDTASRSTLLLSISSGVAIGVAMVGLEVVVLKQYGLALFLGTPFIMGAVTAFVWNRRYPTSNRATAQTTVLMFLTASGFLFFMGAEGVMCILMASPLVLVIGLLGSILGREIALRCRHALPPAFFALFVLPLSSVLELPRPAGHTLHEVRTAVEIAAPPDRVWSHVIAFAPITSLPDLVFRLGIAQPLSARIEGTGVGAVRYCEFSSGAFVEPITAWESGRRLAFNVTSSPPPLRELSLYSNVSAPHLHGYLRSQRGEFRLVALAGGATRLEGSTWYELDMAPEGYWQFFSDYLIHAVHRRVLAHIKDEVERTPAVD